MSTLFDLEPIFPQGFFYYPDFLREEEEAVLYEEISKLDLRNLDYHGYTALRRVISFGYDYDYGKNELKKGNDIPPAFHFLIEKVAEHLFMAGNEFSELLVTEYPPGAVINWHRDAPQFGLIAGISLLSDCIFRLRPYEKAKQTRTSVLSFPVERRSLYVMKGAARWEWQHSTAPVRQIRYSITLRTMRN
jgi:alkylated DNA repair dioxygenase AlkB